MKYILSKTVERRALDYHGAGHCMTVEHFQRCFVFLISSNLTSCAEVLLENESCTNSLVWVLLLLRFGLSVLGGFLLFFYFPRQIYWVRRSLISDHS